MFKSITPAPPDAILGLTEAFKKDENPRKVNLGVGVYKDDDGRTPVLHCVKEAEQRLVAEQTTKSYLPIPGAPAYAQLVQQLLFGEDHAVFGEERARTAHTPGGTGALRVGADSIRGFSPDAAIWMSKPTWANHKGIFGGAGFEVNEYPYYNVETRGVDLDGMIEVLNKVPAGDVVLLHVCCHNPTGVDLSLEQWKQVAGIAAEKGWIPFLDFAYQGFGDDLYSDASPVQMFLDAGVEFWVASSFSKNVGLYCERTGALTLVAKSSEEADAAFSHVKTFIRRNYSNPPAHGGQIVVAVLQDAELRKLWEEELAGMRLRIKEMRSVLVNGLASRGVDRDFSFIEQQRGMFSFSGLREDQVARLRDEKSIYIVGSGRINVAGITTKNADYLCDAIAEVLG